MEYMIDSWEVGDPVLGPPPKRWKRPVVRSRTLAPSAELGKIRFDPMEFISFRSIMAFGMLLDKVVPKKGVGMMSEIERTSGEVDDLLDKAAIRAAKKSHFPWMTYEQGVRDVLEWLTDPTESDPLEDD